MPAERARDRFDQVSDDTLIANTAIMQSLSHPLRMRLLKILRSQGPSTATKLAGLVGESSGLTSYHLRQLASAGLVVEAGSDDLEGVQQTGGRERWWKAAHRSTLVTEMPTDDDGAAVMLDYAHTVIASYAAQAHAWLSAAESWPREWWETTELSDTTCRLTIAEANQLRHEIQDLVARYRTATEADAPPDAVLVNVQYAVFPNAEQEPPKP